MAAVKLLRGLLASPEGPLMSVSADPICNGGPSSLVRRVVHARMGEVVNPSEVPRESRTRGLANSFYGVPPALSTSVLRAPVPTTSLHFTAGSSYAPRSLGFVRNDRRDLTQPGIFNLLWCPSDCSWCVPKPIRTIDFNLFVALHCL